MRSKNNCLFPFYFPFSVSVATVPVYFFLPFFILFIPPMHIKIGINKDVLRLGPGKSQRKSCRGKCDRRLPLPYSHHITPLPSFPNLLLRNFPHTHSLTRLANDSSSR